MIRMLTWASMTALVVVGVQVGGCTSFTRPVVFNLGPGLGEFELVANEPLTKSGTADFQAGVTLRQGSLRINPDAISFTPSNSTEQKGTTTFQTTTTIQVTVWIAEFDQEENVFEDGDEYGPYTITFDMDFVPISVSPSTINLTQRTIDLLNSGQFSIGLQAVSSVDGTLVIDSLTFTVGL